MNKGKYVAFTFICIILGIALSLQYKSTVAIKKADAQKYQRIQEVQNELFLEREKIEKLKKDLADKDEKIQKYETSIARESEKYTVLNDSLMEARLLAGLRNVTGQGVEVRIDDTPGWEVYFQDLLEMLNVIKAAGAQAISINGERVIATTEVINAGGYITINSNRYRAPFIIKAIGKPDVLESSLKMKGGIIEKLKQFNLKVDIKKVEELEIPQYNGPVNIDLLKPVQ